MRCEACLHQAIGVAVILLVSASLGLAGGSNEPPMLVDAVQSGQLPPLNDRIPTDPSVLYGTKIGVYGGTAHVVDVADHSSNEFIDRPELGRYLLQYNSNGEIIGDIARSFESSADMKQHIIRLRDGMRWSDGEFFTADDIVFRFNAMEGEDRQRIYDVFPEVTEATPLDDYTVQLFTNVPAPGIWSKMATWKGGSWTAFAPEHYLSEWTGNDEKAQQLARELGLEYGWEAIEAANHGDFGDRARYKPTLHPWKLDERSGEDGQVLVRNPFYARVDAAGNQLPYIDRVVAVEVPDEKSYILEVLTGEADIAYRHTTYSDVMLLEQAADSGAYNVRLISPSIGILLNFRHSDPCRADLFRDVRFRRALSLAIDRDALVNMGYTAALRQSSFVEYQPVQARALLEAIRVVENDETCSNDVLTLNLHYHQADFEHHSRLIEKIRADWESIGIAVEFSSDDSRSVTMSGDGSELDALVLIVVDGWNTPTSQDASESDDDLEVLEIVGLGPHPFVANDKIRNVPEVIFARGLSWRGSFVHFGEQLFFER